MPRSTKPSILKIDYCRSDYLISEQVVVPNAQLNKMRRRRRKITRLVNHRGQNKLVSSAHLPLELMGLVHWMAGRWKTQKSLDLKWPCKVWHENSTLVHRQTESDSTIVRVGELRLENQVMHWIQEENMKCLCVTPSTIWKNESKIISYISINKGDENQL